MGVVGPNPGFLQGLRDLCDREGGPAHFRRGYHRLPPGQGGCRGVLRRAGRPGHLREDHRRGHARGGLRRQPGPDGAGGPLRPGVPGGDPLRQPGGHGRGPGPAHLSGPAPGGVYHHRPVGGAPGPGHAPGRGGHRRPGAGQPGGQPGGALLHSRAGGGLLSASRSDLDKYAAYFGEMLARGSTWPPPSSRPCSSLTPTPRGTSTRRCRRRGRPSPGCTGKGDPGRALPRPAPPGRLPLRGRAPAFGGAGSARPQDHHKTEKGRLTPSFSVTACRPGGPQPSSSFSSSRA